MVPTETLVVRFEDEHHHNLHRLLTDAGFTCQVTQDLQVGRRYWHPKKPIKVWLEDGQDDEAPWLECKVFYKGKVQTSDEYSKAEWDWMTNIPGGSATPAGEIEVLRRELHILINMRPRYMTRAQIDAAS